MFGSQVKNTQTLPASTFLEQYDCNKATIDLDTLYFLSSLPLAETVALCRSVMKDNILCELYVDTYSDV
jgi:hypothetical protein